MAKTPSPIPAGYHTVTPFLTVSDASKAIDFYKRAFGAEEVFRMNDPNGKVMHAEIRVGDSIIMLSDEFPNMGARSPQTLGGVAGGLMLYVNDVDKSYNQAVSAGGKNDMPPQDMFWGDRFGRLTDPFGHQWSIATHIEDLKPEEIEKRAKDFYAKMHAA